MVITQFNCSLGKKPCLKKMYFSKENREKLEMTSTSSTHMSSLQTPIFSRKNYDYWYLIMKALFRGQYVWNIVQNGYTEPTNHAAYNNLMQAQKDGLREQQNKDGNALFYVHPTMHENILPRVASTNTTRRHWTHWKLVIKDWTT